MVVHADTETPLYVELLPTVVLEVTYTEPGLKGDTASSTALKPAEVETGARVMVPLFINTGEKNPYQNGGWYLRRTCEKE